MDLRLLSIPLLFALAACSGEPEADDAQAPAAAPAVPAGTAAAPAPASTAATVSTAERTPLPIAPDAIAYFGFKTAPFGSDETMLRSAWNGELVKQGPQQADGCYYLYPQAGAQAPGPGRQSLGFMFERGRFARIDVDDPALIAPGGGRIGMSTHDIATRYAQRLEVQPHKYVDGAQYLRVPDAGGSGQVLLFETDANGQVTRWRIGAPPQIDYVEGCA
ncbi:lectin [Lysobacter korlensis]|uniref:Lectin n=1 Tax=Lysobacter korlensis TaxID=553636 RepID=A0ABV6RKB1_9GAMM